MFNYTFAMIKCGAIMRKQTMAIMSAVSTIEAKILDKGHRHLTMTEIEALYGEHVGKHFWGMLVDSVALNCGVVTMVLHGPFVISRWRNLMGATDPKKALPGTLRYDYGVADADNAVHGSATPNDALREINIFYPDLLPAYARGYVEFMGS